MSTDLEDVITSSIEDAVTPEAPAEVDSTPEPAESTPETPLETTPEAPDSTTPTEEAPDTTDSGVVASPTVKAAAEAAAKPEQDDFEKKFGIPKESSPGRENRIPYSRVTKIVGKAVTDAKKEVEATFTPRITEFETKVKDFEAKVERGAQLEQKVADFEKFMLNEPEQFIARLKGLPQYQTFFSQQAPVPAVPETPPVDDMPQPDQELTDGSKVYSMDGLKKLNEWNRAQARKETIAEVQKMYGPIAKSYEESQRDAEARKYQEQVVIPAINAQIQEAYTWPLFKENEEAIVKVLNENPKFNLERAYQSVIIPLMQTNKDTTRKQILAELKKAPIATSAPSSGARPPARTQPTTSGPRDLEAIIQEQVDAHLK